MMIATLQTEVCFLLAFLSVCKLCGKPFSSLVYFFFLLKLYFCFFKITNTNTKVQVLYTEFTLIVNKHTRVLVERFIVFFLLYFKNWL